MSKRLASEAFQGDEAYDHGDLSSQQISELVDGAESMGALDPAELKRMVKAFESKVAKNQTQRMKYPDDPSKFMDSEMDLDEALNELQVIAGAPELYGDMIKMGIITTILSLIPHENTDISVAAVALISELSDPETAIEADDPEKLVDTLLENSLLELLVQNLPRLDESIEEDSQGAVPLPRELTSAGSHPCTAPLAAGVYNTMAVMEHLVELRPSIVDTICAKAPILEWLIERSQLGPAPLVTLTRPPTRRTRAKKKPLGNRVYVSETLAILLQSSEANKAKFVAIPGSIDMLLEVTAAYKRKDPATPEEEELVENLFDVLCAVLMLPAAKEAFRKGEGLELMVIMIKEKKFTRRRALKVLDYALNGDVADCERFVEILGLKTLFSAFMKRSKKASEEKEDEEHAVCCITHLLKTLTGSSLQRVLHKFCRR